MADPRTAADYIRSCCAQAGCPGPFHSAAILGSGLGAPGDLVLSRKGIAVSYAEIPGMPQSAVTGHAGRLVIGTGRHSGLLLLQGRVHHYEGYDWERVTFGVRVLAELGVRRLIVTNAAGGIRSTLRIGDLMLIDGHWSFLNVGMADKSPQPQRRTELWSRRLIEMGLSIDSGLNLQRGVYAMMSGPCYETPAEVRMLRTLGIDAVGMSTVPEAIVAARHGMEVLGVSCITNAASGLGDEPLDHSHVAAAAAQVEHMFTQWLFAVLEQV